MVSQFTRHGIRSVGHQAVFAALLLFIIAGCGGGGSSERDGQPVLVQSNPSPGAVEVVETVEITVHFPHPMDHSSINSETLYLRDAQGQPVAARSSYLERTAWTPIGPVTTYTGYLIPEGPLAYASRYTATLSAGVRDGGGRPFPRDYSWNFTTRGNGTGYWNPVTTAGAPSPRADHTAVWTGSEMIVWGGEYNGFYYGDGGRYDPVANSWRTVSTTGAPSGRRHHTAVWTGTEMIVWGGEPFRDDLGSRYDPAADSWRPVSSVGQPSPRKWHVAVWTGREMIVWGGYDGTRLDSGGRYDPVEDQWRPISTANAPAGYALPAVWTGREMIVWGGSGGAAYNPDTDSWRTVATSGAPSARWDNSAVWSGREMLVWGGTVATNAYAPLNTGGRYEPGGDAWTNLPGLGAPPARYSHGAVWTGREMIVWGGGGYEEEVGFGTRHHLYSGGRFDPATNTWSKTSYSGAPVGRAGHSTVWTGTEMIVWGGFSEDALSFYLSDGGRYAPHSPL